MKILPGPCRPPILLALAALFLGPATGLHAQDADVIVVLKSRTYLQVGPSVVSLPEEDFGGSDFDAFTFETFAEAAAPGSLLSGTVTPPPSGPPITLLQEPFELFYEESFESPAELDAAFPDGTYTVDIVGANDGAQQAMVDLTANTYPDVPRFTNYTAAQSIDASTGFTLQWNAPLNGATTDFAFIDIEDFSGTTVYGSPDEGDPGALDGKSNSFLIPGGTLAPGQSYLVYLDIVKPETIDSSYTTAIGGYATFLLMPITTTPLSDAVAPGLDRSVPFDQEGNVPLNSSVVFCFNEPMDTSVPANPGDAITWTGVANPALFSYRWSADGRNLFCSYDPAGSGLPASTEVGWTLNPPASPGKLQDAAGNDLPGSPSPSGSFFTSTTSNFGDPDVEVYQIFKGKIFFQDGPAAQDSGLYAGGFFADLTGFGTISSLDLDIPGGGTVAGLFESRFESFDDEALFASKTDLDKILPNGSYTLNFDTFHDGMESATLTIGVDSYPNGPQVNDFATTQAIDSTQDFTLKWDAFAGGTSNDFILVAIESESGAIFIETPELGETGALDGTTTQFTIPAGTLPPGRLLVAELLFAKVVDVDTTSYPNATGGAAFVSSTCFDIQTIGQPIRPELEVLSTAGGVVQLRLHGELGQPYEVRSSDSATPPWIPFVSQRPFDNVNGFRATFDAFDFPPPDHPARVYQAREIPPGP